MRLEGLEEQNVDGSQQGVTAIALDGDILEIDGWYDAVAVWYARVRLTPQQRETLREALS